MFYSNDHEPIHVHVVKGGAEARFQVQPEVTLMGQPGTEARRAKAGRVYCGGEGRPRMLITSGGHQEIIAARWNEYFKNKK